MVRAIVFAPYTISPKKYSISITEIAQTLSSMKRTPLLISGATLMNRFAHPSTKLRYTFGFVLLPAALLTAALAQNNQPPRSPDPPVLIWNIDLKLVNDLPRNFRTTNNRLNQSNGETAATTGLSHLQASGSGEFSLKG
jgi:hypothetical protein